MSEKFDLSDKNNWSLENVGIIAYTLGFSASPWFIQELEKFIEESVKTAEITIYLETRAKVYFEELQRKKDKQSLL